MKSRYPNSRSDDSLTHEVVGLAMKVHRTLGFGFAETVYRNALAYELRLAKIPFELHPTISVMYEGTEVGVYQADLIISDKLIVELKAASAITDEHCIQLVNYLTATKIENGIVINFGAPSLQFRTKTKNYVSESEPPSS